MITDNGNSKVLDALVKGRDYFATCAWNRDGGYFALRAVDDPYACCGVGAVVAAAGTTNTATFRRRTGIPTWAIHQQLYAALTPEQKTSTSDFYEFNDNVAESKDDVLAVFDRAIENLRAEVDA